MGKKKDNDNEAEKDASKSSTADSKANGKGKKSQGSAKKKKPAKSKDPQEQNPSKHSTPKRSPPEAKKTTTPSRIEASAEEADNNAKKLKDVYDSIEEWLNERESENQAENKILDKLKQVVRGQKLKLAKEAQLGLELQAYLTNMIVAEHLKRQGVEKWAKFFYGRCEDCLNVIFAIADDADEDDSIDTSNIRVTLPYWKKWKTAADAIQEALKVEQESFENFHDLTDMANDSGIEIADEVLEKKERLAKYLQDLAKWLEDQKH